MDLLTPSHGLWEEFCDHLGRVTCRNSLFNATGLLEHYAESEGVDVEGTLEWFRANGGFCDCEVLLNIDLVSRGEEALSAEEVR